MTRPTAADRTWARVRRQAFVRFDRSTAYGCALRKQPYDAEKCRSLWKAYIELVENV